MARKDTNDCLNKADDGQGQKSVPFLNPLLYFKEVQIEETSVDHSIIGYKILKILCCP